jgi:hypothetical protein
MMSYAMQALVQLGVVIWSIAIYTSHGEDAVTSNWFTVVMTIDGTITILLVVDVLAHLMDQPKVYFADWGNRVDAAIVLLIVLSFGAFFSNKWRGEEADAANFSARLVNDMVSEWIYKLLPSSRNKQHLWCSHTPFDIIKCTPTDTLHSHTPLAHPTVWMMHIGLTMHSLCTHYALTMYSLCTHYALTMHSLCTHYALTMHSLCTHYALTLKSIRIISPAW